MWVCSLCLSFRPVSGSGYPALSASAWAFGVLHSPHWRSYWQLTATGVVVRGGLFHYRTSHREVSCLFNPEVAVCSLFSQPPSPVSFSAQVSKYTLMRCPCKLFLIRSYLKKDSNSLPVPLWKPINVYISRNASKRILIGVNPYLIGVFTVKFYR